MKKIVVTPAGRKVYLELLHNNLKKCKDEFDHWVLWINTTNQNDIDYMLELESKYDWIKLQYSKIGINGNLSIYHFFKECIDDDAVYIRLDDDIIYVHKNSLKELFIYRIENPTPFLVYGNIINNSIISHIHQRNMRFLQSPKIGYSCTDPQGWSSSTVAKIIHENFLSSLEKNKCEDFFMPNWLLYDFEKCSINVISWLGSEFKKFDGDVGSDEEQWLSCDKPRKLNKPNVIFGKSVFVHYAFYTQRDYLNTTNILSKYVEISKEKNERMNIITNLEKEKLIQEILKNKLFIDYRGNIYHPEYESHLSLTGGCWQFPEELADLLLFLREKDISTFFNVGTFNGVTFNIISDFLNTRKNVECITIDPVDHSPIKKEKYKYLRNTTNEFRGKSFDLVFIDGHHGYDYVKNDYENVGQYAKICVFHDIYDDFVLNEPSCMGGVPKFWQEIKKDKKFIEFNSPKKIMKIMGIGVILNQ